MFDPFDGSSKLLSTISSANFNGAIPDLVIQYPDAVTDDLIPGRFFLITDTYYLITRVDENIDPTTTDTISYNVWYTAGGVERYKTILNGVKIFTDGTELQIKKDDWVNKSIGSSGWTITTEGNSVFSNVAVRGTIEATDGYFDGHLYVGDPDDPDSPGGMRIGTNVDGTRENPGTQDGIYINANNYWYDSGLFKIGNDTNNVIWNNTDLAVTGKINATGGVFQGKVQIGNMFIGVDAFSTLDGIHINGTNYWYDNGNFSLGTGTSTISFNGSNILFGTGIEISGSISANSLLLNNGLFSMQIKSNHNVVPSSQRIVTQVALSTLSPQLVLTTSTNHTFLAESFISLSGLSNSGGGLGALNKVFQISNVTSNTITILEVQSTKEISVNADNSDSTLAVVDSDGVYVGMSVSGVGIAPSTIVTNVTDTVITISNATTQALSNVLITFTTIPGLYNLSDSGWSDGLVQLSYDGIFINSNNYWYSNGLFGIGNGSNGVTWNGSELNVTGIINASEGGSIAGWEIGTSEIYKGTGSSKIALNAGTTPKIYIGEGTHANANTGFYVDSEGKFSLSNLLVFSPSLDIPEVTTTGTFNSGTNTITVASSAGIVKGMVVLGTGIDSNSTVTAIAGTTITTTKAATGNGSGVPLTFLLDDFSELQVNGRIKGVIESTSPISSPRIGTTATSVVVSGTVGNQVAEFTTTGHAFVLGEKILIENLPTTNGLNNLNKQLVISDLSDSVTFEVLVPNKTNSVTEVEGIDSVISSNDVTYVSNGTTTVTATSTFEDHGLIVGEVITISGAVGTEQEKLNGIWTIATTPTPRTFTFVVSVAPTAGDLDTNVGLIEKTTYAKYTSAGHNFIIGETVAISGSSVSGYNGTFTIVSIDTNTFEVRNTTRTTPVTFTLGTAILSTTNSTNTGLNSTITLRELTMGLHPASNPGTSYAHTDGSGIRLDKFNWWYTNNQFRVGSVDSYVKWNGTSLDINGIINAQSGTFIGNVDFGTGDSKVRIGPTVYQGASGTFLNPDNYWLKFDDGSVSFHLGDDVDGLDYYQGQLALTGTVTATSGRFGGDTGWLLTESGVLSSGLGSSYLALASADAEISETTNQTFTISQIIIDDEAYDNYDGEYPNANVSYSTFYISVPISQVAFNRTASRTNSTNSTIITVDSSVGLFPGMGVTGTGIQAGTVISSISPDNSKIITLSKATTTTGTVSITFTPNITSAIDMFDNKYIFFQSGFTGNLSVLNGRKFLVELVDNDIYSIVDGDPEDPNTMYDYVESTETTSNTHITVQVYGESAFNIATNSPSPIQTYTSLTTAFPDPEDIDPEMPQYKDLITVNGSIQGVYTTGISTNSYVPKLTQGSKTYMLWAGAESPTNSKLSISVSNSAIEANRKVKIQADMGTTPVGSIVMWYSANIPTGWMECNGQSTTGYDELKAVLGNALTVPDLRGRFPLGRGGTIAAALGGTGGNTTYTYGVAAHSHDMGNLTNDTNLANVSTSITEGTLNAFNVSITEGSAKANTGNHSHGVSGNSTANNSNIGYYVPNSGTLISFADDKHTHADGNYATTSYGGDAGGSHTHSVNAFTGSVTEGTMNSFSLTNSGVAGDTLGVIGASTANITSVIPPYLGVIFIIYHGVG
jgi:microcystin-dependent protein